MNDSGRNGEILEIKNIKGALSINYLALPINTFSEINKKGYTVSSG